MNAFGGSAGDSSGLPADQGRVRRDAWPVAETVLVTFLADAVLIALYALAPLDLDADRHPVLRTLGALLLLSVLVVWQIRAISRAPRPQLRAFAAIGFLSAVYLLGWAAAYVAHSAAAPDAFTEPLSRFDALYFAVTVFATVGFGDVVPLTQAARVSVTVQMVLNLVMIGAVLRLVVATARTRSRSLGGG
ncbi:potassium channel family protein [Streptomonospora litoralis]|uniref:Voltage-gated potassium channel n=1 Tax=Streptomonospora litoralis TaxID=2498135 RepID=A0A4P6Q5S7_9ACTN|nr:potassium channel family protein [Streptomonospora litoralis]QBI56013.1 voltage-gated potassium channel [Streptomonospora litoralis]